MCVCVCVERHDYKKSKIKSAPKFFFFQMYQNLALGKLTLLVHDEIVLIVFPSEVECIFIASVHVLCFLNG